MDEKYDISVVIITHNRCEMLPRSLESIIQQNAPGIAYEVVLVDNNSTDQTRSVVEAFIARKAMNLRYVFEKRQGRPHARNAGVENARAPIIAFIDDDIRAATDWLVQIKRALDAHPEVDFVGGKVLPQWGEGPPAWLTRAHWPPLALTDRGDQSIYVSAQNPRCLVSANLAVRREAFEQVGLFAPEFLRSQDHDWQLRVYLAGRQGMYVPEIIVTAEVQAERLGKLYHRKWHTRHGRYCAMMRLEEMTGPDGQLVQENPKALKLFGTSVYTYRRLLVQGRRWLANTLRRKEDRSFKYENKIRYYLSYIGQNYRQNAASRRHSGPTEFFLFLKTLLRKV